MFGVWRWVSTQELCSGVGVIGLSLAHAASQDKGDLVKPSLWKKGVVPNNGSLLSYAICNSNDVIG